MHHFVEGANQRGQLVDRLHLHAIGQVALAHLARGHQQSGNRHADLAREQQRDPGGHEQNEQRDQQQEQQVQLADGILVRGELIVFVNVLLNLGLRFLELDAGPHADNQHAPSRQRGSGCKELSSVGLFLFLRAQYAWHY